MAGRTAALPAALLLLLLLAMSGGASVAPNCTALPAASCSGLDILVVMDGSESVSPMSFTQQKAGIAALGTNATALFGPGTGLALIEYSTLVNTVSASFEGLSGFLVALGVLQSQGVTNTADALAAAGAFVRTHATQPSVVVLVTDGPTSRRNEAQLPAALASVQNVSSVFAVGVGLGYDLVELNQIASTADPAVQSVFEAPFNLAGVLDSLLQEIGSECAARACLERGNATTAAPPPSTKPATSPAAPTTPATATTAPTALPTTSGTASSATTTTVAVTMPTATGAGPTATTTGAATTSPPPGPTNTSTTMPAAVTMATAATAAATTATPATATTINPTSSTPSSATATSTAASTAPSGSTSPPAGATNTSTTATTMPTTMPVTRPATATTATGITPTSSATATVTANSTAASTAPSGSTSIAASATSTTVASSSSSSTTGPSATASTAPATATLTSPPPTVSTPTSTTTPTVAPSTTTATTTPAEVPSDLAGFSKLNSTAPILGTAVFQLEEDALAATVALSGVRGAVMDVTLQTGAGVVTGMVVSSRNNGDFLEVDFPALSEAQRRSLASGEGVLSVGFADGTMAAGPVVLAEDVRVSVLQPDAGLAGTSNGLGVVFVDPTDLGDEAEVGGTVTGLGSSATGVAIVNPAGQEVFAAPTGVASTPSATFGTRWTGIGPTERGELTSGALSTNVKTSSNPAGELRGGLRDVVEAAVPSDPAAGYAKLVGENGAPVDGTAGLSLEGTGLAATVALSGVRGAVMDVTLQTGAGVVTGMVVSSRNNGDFLEVDFPALSEAQRRSLASGEGVLSVGFADGTMAAGPVVLAEDVRVSVLQPDAGLAGTSNGLGVVFVDPTDLGDEAEVGGTVTGLGSSATGVAIVNPAGQEVFAAPTGVASTPSATFGTRWTGIGPTERGELTSGALSTNVKTSSNPAGELRGGLRDVVEAAVPSDPAAGYAKLVGENGAPVDGTAGLSLEGTGLAATVALSGVRGAVMDVTLQTGAGVVTGMVVSSRNNGDFLEVDFPALSEAQRRSLASGEGVLSVGFADGTMAAGPVVLAEDVRVSVLQPDAGLAGTSNGLGVVFVDPTDLGDEAEVGGTVTGLGSSATGVAIVNPAGQEVFAAPTGVASTPSATFGTRWTGIGPTERGELTSGALSTNVKTSSNPAGELRGGLRDVVEAAVPSDPAAGYAKLVGENGAPVDGTAGLSLEGTGLAATVALSGVRGAVMDVTLQTGAGVVTGMVVSSRNNGDFLEVDFPALSEAQRRSLASGEGVLSVGFADGTMAAGPVVLAEDVRVSVLQPDAGLAGTSNGLGVVFVDPTDLGDEAEVGGTVTGLGSSATGVAIVNPAGQEVFAAPTGVASTPSATFGTRWTGIGPTESQQLISGALSTNVKTSSNPAGELLGPLGGTLARIPGVPTAGFARLRRTADNSPSGTAVFAFSSDRNLTFIVASSSAIDKPRIASASSATLPVLALTPRPGNNRAEYLDGTVALPEELYDALLAGELSFIQTGARGPIVVDDLVRVLTLDTTDGQVAGCGFLAPTRRDATAVDYGFTAIGRSTASPVASVVEPGQPSRTIFAVPSLANGEATAFGQRSNLARADGALVLGERAAITYLGSGDLRPAQGTARRSVGLPALPLILRYPVAGYAPGLSAGGVGTLVASVETPRLLRLIGEFASEASAAVILTAASPLYLGLSDRSTFEAEDTNLTFADLEALVTGRGAVSVAGAVSPLVFDQAIRVTTLQTVASPGDPDVRGVGYVDARPFPSDPAFGFTFNRLDAAAVSTSLVLGAARRRTTGQTLVLDNAGLGNTRGNVSAFGQPSLDCLVANEAFLLVTTITPTSGLRGDLTSTLQLQGPVPLREAVSPLPTFSVLDPVLLLQNGVGAEPDNVNEAIASLLSVPPSTVSSMTFRANCPTSSVDCPDTVAAINIVVPSAESMTTMDRLLRALPTAQAQSTFQSLGTPVSGLQLYQDSEYVSPTAPSASDDDILELSDLVWSVILAALVVLCCLCMLLAFCLRRERDTEPAYASEPSTYISPQMEFSRLDSAPVPMTDFGDSRNDIYMLGGHDDHSVV